MRPIVLSLTTMNAAGLDLLRARTDLRMASSLQPEVLWREVAPADGLVLRTAGVIDAPLMDHAPKLRVIGRHGVGFDHVDIEAATARGIQVVSTPGANTQAVVEHTFAFLIGVSKHFPKMMAAVAEFRHDDRTRFSGRELFGRTLGIVGFGRIGRRVAETATRGFSMRVLYHDIVAAPPDVERQCGVERVGTLDELLERSEYVSLHVPLDASTRKLIGRAALLRVRPGTILINTCRGPVVDEQAVAEALDDGRLFGYAADVYEVEPPLPGHPLIGRADVMLTPHSAAQTEESLVKMARWMAEDVLRVLEGEAPIYPVNDPAEVAAARRRRG